MGDGRGKSEKIKQKKSLRLFCLHGGSSEFNRLTTFFY